MGHSKTLTRNSVRIFITFNSLLIPNPKKSAMPKLFTLLASFLFSGSLFAQITTFPYTENFDSFPFDDLIIQPGAEPNLFPNNWTNVQTGDDPQDWYGRTVGTASGNTGPDFDHTSGSGVYVYVEDGFGNNDSVRLVSPTMDISSLANPRLTYWVHSNEAAASVISNLMTVDVFYNGSWNIGVDVVGHIGTTWTRRVVNLSAYPGVIQIRFSVNNSTTTFTHDIAIDDFRVFDFPQHDAGIGEANVYTSEYYMTPLNQAQGYTFDGQVENAGSNSITGVELKVDVTNDAGTTVHQDSASIANINSGNSSIITLNDTFFPTAVDTYHAQFLVDINELDTTAFNDTANREFIITDTIMAREDGLTTGGIGFNGATGEFGQMMEIFTADTLTTVSVYLLGPTAGDSFRVNLYTYDTLPGTLLQVSSTQVIPTATSDWYTLRMGCGVVLQPGKYFIAAEQLNTNNVSIGYTNNFYTPDVTYFKSGTAPWTAFETVPFFVSLLIRANFGNVQPTNTMVTAASTLLCQGESTMLTATGAQLYDWSPGAAVSSTSGDTVMASPSSTQWIYVTGTDGYGCSPTTDSVQININPSPAVNLGNDTTICANVQIPLIAPTGLSSYQWSDGTSGSSIQVSAVGTYTVTVTDGLGCTNTDSIEITNDTVPVIDLGNDTAVCDGFAISLVAPGTWSAYSWSNGNSGPVALFNTAGFHFLTVTDGNGCQGFDSLELVLFPKPPINLGNDTNIFDNIPAVLDPGPGYVTYTWSTNANSQTITVSDPGAYWVSVVDTAGCTNTDTIVIGVVPNGIDELGKEVNALIFPNPAQYQLNIQITGLPNLPLQLELMDLQGRAVLSRQYVGSTINEQLELEGLPSGTYLLRLTNRNGTLTERIVVR